MSLKNIGNSCLYLLIIFICLLGFAHLKLQGNYAYLGISPNPLILTSFIAAILFDNIRTLFISIITTIVYFVALDFQADYQLIDSIFTFESLSIAFTILTFPIVISEVIGRNRKSIQSLETNNNDKDRVIEALKNEVDATKDGLETISKKYTEHSLSDIEILEFIESSINTKIEKWAEGIASFATNYLGNCKIEMFYGDFHYTHAGKQSDKEESSKICNTLLEVFDRNKSKSILTPLDPQWPSTIQGLNVAAFLIDFKGPKKGLLLASNISFQSYLEQHLERISKLLVISAKYTVISNEYSELKYNQATIGDAKIMGPVVYKEIISKLNKLIGASNKTVNQYRIVINSEFEQEESIQDEVLGNSWLPLIGDNDIIFKIPNSNEYHLVAIGETGTSHPLLNHIEKTKTKLKNPDFITFYRQDI